MPCHQRNVCCVFVVPALQSWCQSLFAQTQLQLSQLKGFEAALLLRGLAVIQVRRVLHAGQQRICVLKHRHPICICKSLHKVYKDIGTTLPRKGLLCKCSR